MRFTSLVLAGFLAVRVAAQVVDPNELTYGPFEPGPGDPSFSLAVASHGMLLTWSEMDQEANRATIHAGLLDFDAQLAGPIHKLQSVRDDMHSTTPKVVTDGTTFLVTWIDRERGSYYRPRTVGVYTDSAGIPVELPRTYAVGTTSAFIWDGEAYRVHNLVDSRQTFFATPEADGSVIWYNNSPRPLCVWFCKGPPSYTEPEFVFHWTVQSTSGWTRHGRFSEVGYLATGFAVTASSDDLLAVWSTPKGLEAMRVDDGRRGKSFVLENELAADATLSMAGSLVAFEQKGDIYGSVVYSSVVKGDSFGQPFPITTGAETESRPRVYRVNDRYLVTYVREHSPRAVSLAGRFVTISP